jgi:hypothetical protein
MAGSKGLIEALRFSRNAHLVIDRGSQCGKGTPQAFTPGPKDDTEMLLALSAIGKRLADMPSAPDAMERRDSLMSRVSAMPLSRAVESEPGKGQTWAWRKPVLASAVVLLIAIVAFAAAGFGSVNAMPGSPLYSLKRFVEVARDSFTFDHQARAEAYLGDAERRVKELEYAKHHNMSGWYYGLARDALSALDDAQGQVQSLMGAGRQAVVSRAQNVASNFNTHLQQTLPGLDRDQQQRLEQQKQRMEQRQQQQQQQQQQRPPAPRQSTPAPPQQQQQPPPGQQVNPVTPQQPPPSQQGSPVQQPPQGQQSQTLNSSVQPATESQGRQMTPTTPGRQPAQVH